MSIVGTAEVLVTANTAGFAESVDAESSGAFSTLSSDSEKAGEDAGSKLSSGMSKGTSGIKSVLSSLGVPDALMSGWAAFGLAVVGVGALAVDLGVKMQSADAAIAVASGSSVKSATAIGDAFLSTAGKSEFSGQEIAAAYATVAGQLKATEGQTLTTAQAMTVMNAAQDLATAKQISLGSATTSLAGIMQAFKLPVQDASAATDILFNASNSTGQSVDSLGSEFDKLKSKLGDTSPPLGALAALMVDMTNQGITGRAALTGVNTAMTGLQAAAEGATPAGQAAEAELKSMGLSATTSTGQLTPMSTIIEQLGPKFDKMSQSQQLATASTIFGTAASKDMVSVIDAGPAAYDAATASVTKMGTAHAAAGVESQTLGVEMKTLKATIDDVMTSIGQALIPILDTLVGGLEKVIKPVASVLDYFAKSKTATEALAVAIGVVAVAAVGVFVGSVIAGMSAATAATGGIILAVGLVAAAAVELATHWDSVWTTIKNSTEEAINFVIGKINDLINIAKNVSIFGWHPAGGMHDIVTFNINSSPPAPNTGSESASASAAADGMLKAAGMTQTAAQITEAAQLKVDQMAEVGKTGLALTAAQAQVAYDKVADDSSSSKTAIATAQAAVTVANAAAANALTNSAGGITTAGKTVSANSTKLSADELAQQKTDNATLATMVTAAHTASLAKLDIDLNATHTAATAKMVSELDATHSTALASLATKLVNEQTAEETKRTADIDAITKAGNTTLNSMLNATTSGSLSSLNTALDQTHTAAMNKFESDAKGVHTTAMANLVQQVVAAHVAALATMNLELKAQAAANAATAAGGAAEVSALVTTVQQDDAGMAALSGDALKTAQAQRALDQQKYDDAQQALTDQSAVDNAVGANAIAIAKANQSNDQAAATLAESNLTNALSWATFTETQNAGIASAAAGVASAANTVAGALTATSVTIIGDNATIAADQTALTGLTGDALTVAQQQLTVDQLQLSADTGGAGAASPIDIANAKAILTGMNADVSAGVAIPSLAVGGLVNKGGLVMIHSGEAVIPAASVGASPSGSNSGSGVTLYVAPGAVVINPPPGTGADVVAAAQAAVAQGFLALKQQLEAGSNPLGAQRTS